MFKYVVSAAALLLSNNAFAQTGEMRAITLAPNTEVVVTPNDTLTTKSLKVGDKFKIATVFDVMQDGYVLIPRGTPGEATVSYRTGKGAFGKSAKMEVTFNWLKLGDRQIPLNGTYRQEGQGNAGAAVGAVVAVGVFGAFVTGHSATITNGQQLRTHTAETISFNVPAGAAPIQAAIVAPAAPVATLQVTPTAAVVPAAH
ncbi:hypothetical protein [Novosphingobium sp. SG707]|uniref:hypothetical protein n=1 Tax=Novosphingobium sp. SG707 TaxID=2586996 RepID=UPI001445C11B|nr:hypothetical protein [Novosphingobium sp. SG707]NKJ02023.1 hypothetical protein [Novosphingobium sp. SG707]